MKLVFQIIIVTLTFTSCEYFKSPQKPEAVARVGNNYLFRNDLQGLVPKGTSPADSVVIVKSFIERWATQKLLYEAAEINLSDAKVQDFNELINQYKIDLFTKGYLEELIIRKIDTVVTNAEINKYYENNKQYFKNASELVKLRYINLVKENPKFEKIKSKFSSFTAKDKKELTQMAIQFKSYAFNDSIWVDINQIYQKLPFINMDNKQKYIADGISYQYPDSTTVWLVKVKQVLPVNSTSPLQFLRPTIRQVIINQRKLELLRTIEKEITNDAIKNNKYEIYK